MATEFRVWINLRIALSILNPHTNRSDHFKSLLELSFREASVEWLLSDSKWRDAPELPISRLFRKQRMILFIFEEPQLKSNVEDKKERGFLILSSQHSFPFPFKLAVVANSWSDAYTKMKGNWMLWLHAGPGQS